MSTKICWCCQVNLAWSTYPGTKYLDDDGSKPCVECVEEMVADEEELESE